MKERRIHIHEKTLQDLEFPRVLHQISELCVTPLGREEILEIRPFKNEVALKTSLTLTNEYLSSFYNDNRIPNHGFEAVNKELQLLKIENTFLSGTYHPK